MKPQKSLTQVAYERFKEHDAVSWAETTPFMRRWYGRIVQATKREVLRRERGKKEQNL